MANCVDCDSQIPNTDKDCYEQEIILEQENIMIGGGTSDHSKLSNLDYEHAGHIGFQSSLVSGENIKTINNESILGSGNIDIQTEDIAWGNISGEITDQTDLQQEFSKYTPTTSLATVATSGDYGDLLNTPTIPTVNNATLTIQKNSTNIGTFTANASSNETINITVPVSASDVSALPSSTKYGASLSLSINSSTYVLTAQLKDQDNNDLGSAQTVDLPLESVVVSGSYDSTNKQIVLTLQNGNVVNIPVGDLVAGLQTEITSTNMLSADLVDDSTTTNKFVTASDITAWNGKQNALTAGTNISISNDTISATDTTYSAGAGLTLSGTEFSVDTTTIQSKLTPGSNITISGDTISATDTTYSDATTSASGLMSATDKVKLNGIATGAEVNVQANWNETNTSSDAYIQNKPNLSTKEDISNKVTSLSSSSTDTQYPSAKLMYDSLYSITSDNKFDNSYDEVGKLDVTTGEDLSATTYNRTNFRDLGKTITGNLYVTISETTSNFMYICYYDENKVFLKGRTIWEASAADTYEDYVEGARYFRISVKNTWQGSIYISYVYSGVDTANYEYIKKIFTIDDVQKPLDEKIVINLGDSIFGKRRPPNDISTTIEAITGATTYNCGFGGTTAGTHYSQYYDPFALHSLADSIYSGDWSVQDAAVTAGAGVIPDYFADTVDLLESLDFTKVDMITIAYGTNDWNNGMAMDNSNNNKDLATYAGALRYSIEKILAVYPHIKIFLCTPIFRVMLDSSYVVTGDSDTATNINGKKLTDFIEKLKAVALEYHLTYIDNYYGLGINIKNWLYYFKNTDGTHPIYTGCHLIAENMSHYLIGDYTAPSIKVQTENSTSTGDVYDVTYINTMIGDVESILTTLTTGSGV